MINKTFFISADLGQTNDYTAITIIECVGGMRFGYVSLSEAAALAGIPSIKEPPMFLLRHIERPERGTTYPKIVNRIKEICESPELMREDRAVVIDMTGLGKPIWDFMQENGFKNKMNGITITGGNTVTSEWGKHNVPKRDLISALQVAFQNGQLKIAQGLPEAETLVKELTNFKVKISTSGHDSYEAWRESIHDDLVLSAAMGVWLAQQRGCRLYWKRSR